MTTHLVIHEGQRIRCRGRLWEVREAPTVEGGQILTLSPLGDGDWPELTVLHPIEQIEVIEQKEPPWHIGSARGFEILHDGVRLSLKAPPGQVLASRLGRLQIERYQFEPVFKAFQRPTQRVLIADDVGLGKTIEAILIMLELIARGRGNRILVVVPAGLQDQWRDDELYRKAGLEFEIFDSTRIQEVRREYSRGTNPWANRHRVISSVDFLKRDDIRRMLKGVKWDLVVVDEAHYLCESVSGRSVYRTARSRLGEFLASPDVTDNLILLTATPHAGYVRGFYSLLKLVDPYLTPRDDRLDRAVIDPILVRRSKREIFEEDGSRRFKDPQIETLPVDMSPEEEDLYDEVDKYTRREYNRAGRDTAVGFAMTIVKKRLMSSIPALVASLTTREANLSEDLIDVRADRGLIQDYRKGVPLTEEQTSRVEEKLLQAGVAPSDEDVSLEERAQRVSRYRTEVRGILKKAKALDPYQDSKARQLVSKLKEIFETSTEEKVIIFTEYRDTLNFLAGYEGDHGRVEGLLERTGFKGQMVTLTGGMSRKARRSIEAAFHQPETRILVATDAASEGLNLQRKCRILIHYELPWNPNRMVQRNGRIDRWGQTSEKPVLIQNLFRPRSKDDEILSLLLWKVEQIRADLGSATDVIGSTAGIDIDDILLTRGGLKTSTKGDATLEETKSAIESKLEEQKKMMASWNTESVLAAARFSREDHQRVREALDQSEQSLVPETAIKQVVTEVMRRTGGEVEELRGGQCRVRVSQSLRRGAFNRGEIEAATFSQEIASRDENEDVDFLGATHPLVQSVSHRVRAALWDPRGLLHQDRVTVRISPAAPSKGIVFTFLGTVYHKQVRGAHPVEAPYAEYLVPTFVTLDGDVPGDHEGDERLLQIPSSAGEVPPPILENLFRTKFEELRLKAKGEARKRLQKVEATARQRIALQAEKLRQDALRWRDDRRSWIEEQLNPKGGSTALFHFDDEGEQINWQELEERRQRRLRIQLGKLEDTVRQRLTQIDASWQVRSSSDLMWVGALLLIPDYELPYLTEASR